MSHVRSCWLSAAACEGGVQEICQSLRLLPVACLSRKEARKHLKEGIDLGTCCGPTSLGFFLHHISTMTFFSFSIIVFSSNLRIVMKILISFFQPLPLSAPDFQEGKNKGTADWMFLI